jgi:hypothetical protein
VPAAPKAAVRPATLDTAPLNAAALDIPARRQAELERANRLLNLEQLSAGRRAEAAFFLGTAALESGRRDSALHLFQLAWRLDSKPMYFKMIQQTRDSIRP